MTRNSSIMLTGLVAVGFICFATWYWVDPSIAVDLKGVQYSVGLTEGPDNNDALRLYFDRNWDGGRRCSVVYFHQGEKYPHLIPCDVANQLLDRALREGTKHLKEIPTRPFVEIEI